MLLILFSLVAISIAQPQLVSIEGIPVSSLFYPIQSDTSGVLQADVAAGVSPFGVGRPLDGALLPPTSHRTIHKIFNPFRLTNINAANPAVFNTYNNVGNIYSNFATVVGQGAGTLQRNEVILLRYDRPFGALDLPPILRLQQPNLEVDPYICTPQGNEAGTENIGGCRCLNSDGYQSVDVTCFIGTAPSNNLVFCQVPTATYYTFAPLPNENPYIRSYRRICLQAQNPQRPTWHDTQLWYSVQPGCVDTTAPLAAVDPNQLFRCNAAVTPQVGRVINYPNIIGATPPGGFTYLPVAQGNLANNLGPFLIPNGNNFANQFIPTGWQQNAEAWNGETLQQRNDRNSRLQCCGSRVVANNNVDLGICINIAAGDAGNGEAACCGTKPYSPKTEQCCRRTTSRTRSPNFLVSVLDTRALTVTEVDQAQEFWPIVPIINHQTRPCPCNNQNQITAANGIVFNADCTIGPNQFLPADSQGATQAQNPNFQCCVATKFGEYPNTIPVIPPGGGAAINTIVPKVGFCVDVTGATQHMPWLCCNDGNIFDPDTQQCCQVNGVQSRFDGCPCETNANCVNPVAPLATSICCKQRFPNPRLQPENKIDQCGIFANFPTPSTLQPSAAQTLPNRPIFPGAGGNAPTEFQRCTGTCIDSTWQICCNGVVCVDQYERCCNDTCCNKHTQTCVDGYRPGSLTSRFNTLNYNFEFEICSEIEAMNGRRAFNVFIVPVFLLFATVASLAILLTFTRRAVEHVFELTERAIVFFAAFSVLIATVYFFSPMYKFGITIIWINLALIAIAAIRTIRPAILAVILQFILILYIIDPFPANHWFGMSHGATGETELANQNDLPSSLFETAYYWWKDRGVRCTRHFDYFNFDFNTRDTFRHHNPAVRTFGYCSREWISVLMIFAGFLIITELLLLLLVIYSLVKLLGFKPDEVIQLEVRAEPNY